MCLCKTEKIFSFLWILLSLILETNFNLKPLCWSELKVLDPHSDLKAAQDNYAAVCKKIRFKDMSTVASSGLHLCTPITPQNPVADSNIFY